MKKSVHFVGSSYILDNKSEPFSGATEAQSTQKPVTTLCLHPKQSTASEPILL
jgi:hypothetical protein